MIAGTRSLTAGSKTSPEPTVSAGLARGLIRLAVSKGADEALLSARSGIDASDLADHDSRIALARYVVLMRSAKALSGDPALALHYGASNDLSDISVVGLIAYTCETMAEAMMQMNRYGHLVVEVDGPSDRFRVMHDAGGLWLVDGRAHPNDFPELTESTLARAVCGPRRFGVTQIAKAVHVTHAAPAYRDEYERILGAPVTFEAAWNAFLLDEKWLAHKIGVQPRYAFGILAKHADALLENLKNSKSVRGRVEGLLMPILHTGDIGIGVVAAKLGVGRTTLFNNLRKEGTTFKKVLDGLRHKMALQYLRGKKVSVNEIAYLVGFSEPAAFSRAFKRWTGKSPREMRNTG
jgi:AraC-like DNA-binding protein